MGTLFGVDVEPVVMISGVRLVAKVSALVGDAIARDIPPVFFGSFFSTAAETTSNDTGYDVSTAFGVSKAPLSCCCFVTTNRLYSLAHAPFQNQGGGVSRTSYRRQAVRGRG